MGTFSVIAKFFKSLSNKEEVTLKPLLTDKNKKIIEIMCTNCAPCVTCPGCINVQGIMELEEDS